MSVKNLNNRADLLRWYQHHEDKNDSWQDTVTPLGYEYHPPIKLSHSDNKALAEEEGALIEPLEEPKDNNKEAPVEENPQHYYYLSQREPYADEDPLPKDLQGYTPLSKDELRAVEKGNPIPYQSITHKHRLSPFVETNLRQQRGNKTDINRLIRLIAQQKPLQTIPTKPRILPVGRVTVLLDLCDRLLPFWRDSYQVCKIIQQKQGKFGQDIRVINEHRITDDYHRYDDFIKKQHCPQSWQSIPAQSAVFIISDAGQLSDNNSDIRQQWLTLLQGLNKRGIQPIIIAPIAAEQQCPLVQSLSHQVLWHKHSFYRPQKRIDNQHEHQQKVARIIAFLSLSPHSEPELLRAIISTVLGAETSGIEADVFLHTDIQWGYHSINVRLEKREHYQQQLKSESAQIQKQVLMLIKQHHIGQFPAVWYEAVLEAEHIVNFPLDEIADSKAAKEYMTRLAVTGMGDRYHQGLNSYFIRHLERSSQQQKECHKTGFSAVYYALSLHKKGQSVPDEYDAATVQRCLRQAGTSQSWHIVQIGEQLLIQAQQAQGNGMQYGKVLASFDTLYHTVSIDQQIYALDSTQPIFLAQQKDSPEPSFTLDTGNEKITLASLRKPSWADSISQGQEHLIANLHFADKTYPMMPSQQYGEPTNDSHNKWELLSPLSTVGFDEYGLFATLKIKNVSQRFRWIEPGTFIMGSPENEQGRYSDETQHPVTLTQGFWMADTAVTQAFWQAVMGDNPSKSQQGKKAQENPVETVSWDDCQQFIEQLKKHFNLLNCGLPTEAQWEYACRAGTQTAFNFEGELDLDNVNYSGIFDKKGWDDKALQRTAAVKSYPCNAWGLYEMHGNVWEWCQDNWQSDLGTEPQVDPVLFEEGSEACGARWRLGQQTASTCVLLCVTAARLIFATPTSACGL